jgi:UDP-N-acetylmuramyl pentapeptide phosphotransferase/UDP-N-acetylglucosamine-1-phosphate transferase
MALEADARIVLAVGLVAGLSALASAHVPRWAARAGLVRANFQGRRIPTACGAAIVAGATPGLALLALGDRSSAGQLALLWTVLGFGLLGLADDRWGTPAAKGLRGHVRVLLVERRFTSGLVKAIGGAVVALAATGLILNMPWPTAVVCAAVTALGANAANLLDLRPGRASAACLAVLAGCVLAAALARRHDIAAALLCVALPAAILHRSDAQARTMMGDTGSNALGAAAGLGIVLAAPGPVAAFAALASLAALHAIAERWSLSAIIEANRYLRALDALTGIRTGHDPSAPRADQVE